jgi:hypothetical protein
VQMARKLGFFTHFPFFFSGMSALLMVLEDIIVPAKKIIRQLTDHVNVIPYTFWKSPSESLFNLVPFSFFLLFFEEHFFQIRIS